MNAVVLLIALLAAAGEPQRPVDLQALAELGLVEPRYSAAADEVRASIPTGGLVRILSRESEEAARDAFGAHRRTATNVALPPLAQGDEAAGDDHLRVVRSGSVVVIVRDHQGQAGAIVERVLGALAQDGE